MTDIYQIIDNLDSDKRSMVAERLEDCAQMPRFAEIREHYFDKIGLPSKGSIHELGCGTGAVCRAIASRPEFNRSNWAYLGLICSLSGVRLGSRLTW